MGFADRYLKNSSFRENEIAGAPKGLLHYIVIIPAYSEPDIIETLSSLANCILPKKHVEVICLVNYPENASEDVKRQNHLIHDKICQWSSGIRLKNIRFIPQIAENLPNKQAGAGLARKIVMDLAVSRFSQINNDKGIILSLDADCKVPENYFAEVEECINNYPKTDCLLFNFQHEVKGNEFNSKVYEAIVLYELHLRYIKQMLYNTGFPYAYYTIGSCFAVRADRYIKQGGMSKRKAGEDFYFLHKIFPNSHVRFLYTVIINPSVRPSWRVPFGTGPVVRKLLNMFTPIYETYHPKLFKGLSVLIETVPLLYNTTKNNLENTTQKLPVGIKEFLDKENWHEKIHEINKNSSSPESFKKRFFNWFNAFRIIKYLNYSKEKFRGQINVVEAVKIFLEIDQSVDKTSLELLDKLRENDGKKI